MSYLIYALSNIKKYLCITCFQVCMESKADYNPSVTSPFFVNDILQMRHHLQTSQFYSSPTYLCSNTSQIRYCNSNHCAYQNDRIYSQSDSFLTSDKTSAFNAIQKSENTCSNMQQIKFENELSNEIAQPLTQHGSTTIKSEKAIECYNQIPGKSVLESNENILDINRSNSQLGCNKSNRNIKPEQSPHSSLKYEYGTERTFAASKASDCLLSEDIRKTVKDESKYIFNLRLS